VNLATERTASLALLTLSSASRAPRPERTHNDARRRPPGGGRSSGGSTAKELCDFSQRATREGCQCELRWLRSPFVESGYVVIVPPREIDLATANELREEILANDPRHTIVVDLRTVTFCDSTGLAALLTGLQHTSKAGGQLILRYPAPAVARLLEITDMTQEFTVERPPD
jgi:anti-sigma B factor antagonist